MKRAIIAIRNVLSLLTGCMSQGSAPGARMTGAKGTYHWWHFDFTLDDGSTMIGATLGLARAP